MSAPSAAPVASTGAIPLLRLRGVGKDYGSGPVLREIDLDLRAGEIHALVGENGAGKSTLLKILAGLHAATTGTLEVDGHAAHFSSVRAAEAAGVAMIHQEFNLIPTLSVAANLYLGHEPRRWGLTDERTMVAGTREVLARLDVELDPRTPVRDLSVARMQWVEIAKALRRESRLLLLDEPTAVLNAHEAETLHQQMRTLRDAGTGLVFVSHKLDEVCALADRITVLRDGEVVATGGAGDFTPTALAEAMVGRELGDLYPPLHPATDAAPLFTATGVHVPGWVDEAEVAIRPGELHGFAGLMGAGRTELWEGLLGLRKATAQRTWEGQPLIIRDYRDAVAEGLVYLSEDRKGKGLHLGLPLVENLALLAQANRGGWWLDRRKDRAALDAAIQAYDIRTPGPEVTPAVLSGGNQQKLALARTLLPQPRLLVVDEPTRGVDIATKQQIYRLLVAFAEQGGAVVVISSEMPELLGLCARISIMRQGRLVATVTGDQRTEQHLVRHATGVAT